MVNVSRKPKWERNKCVSSHKTDLSPKNTPTTCLFLDVDYSHPSISAKGKNLTKPNLNVSPIVIEH